MNLIITAIPALKDNYIWAIINTCKQTVVIVDPGVADPVHKFLHQQELNLAAIFITHHHWDHSNGICELVANHSVPVYGPGAEAISGATHPVADQDQINLNGFPKFSVISIPGHTRGHVAYYDQAHLFSGDTLFAAGCGRLFEGTAAQMLASLKKLAALPKNTKVYCGHEYTLNNLRFAATVEPDNVAIHQRIEIIELKRQQNQPSLPSIVADELATNPFLRCYQPTIKKNVSAYSDKPLQTEVDIFTYLRKWKDHF